MITIGLKLKYRMPGRLLKRQGLDPPGGTMVYTSGKFHAKPRTNAGKGPKGQSLMPPMHAYWGSVSR